MSSSVNRPPERGDDPHDPRRVPPTDADGARHAAGTGPDDGRYLDDQRLDERPRDADGRDGGLRDGRDTDGRDSGTRDTGYRDGRDTGTPDSAHGDDRRDVGRTRDDARYGEADSRSAAAADTRDTRHTRDTRDREDEAGRRRPGTTERIVKERTRASRGIARTIAAIVALVFLVVGVLGFIPGITTNVDQLAIAGHHSGALLLGVFQVSVLHNVVHLLFGVVGLLMSRTAGAARAFLIVGGLIYLALWVLGLLFGNVDALNIVPVNDADNWLHLGLGVVMLLLGLVVGRRRIVSREIVD